MSTSRITFTRPAADRIANVVRIVEQGSRDEAPLTYSRQIDPQGLQFRLALFTASAIWTVASYTAATSNSNTKTIQFALPFGTATQGTRVICLANGSTATQGTTVVTLSKGPTAMCVNHFVQVNARNTCNTTLMRVLVFKEGSLYRLAGGECT